MYADYVAKSIKWAAIVAATVDGRPASFQAFTAFLERQEREVAALAQGAGRTDGILGMGNPPMMLVKGRKESRHRDAHGTEGCKKRKRPKSEDVAKATPKSEDLAKATPTS